MESLRPYVLTVAGFDPSAGAGILADVKTFEQNDVYGLAVCSAMTLQTEDEFVSVKWTDRDELFMHLRKMLETYPVAAVKTGIMPSLDFLYDTIMHIQAVRSGMHIVVDPVIESTTGFSFLGEVKQDKLNTVLRQVSVLTPNYHEAKKLSGKNNITEAGEYLSAHCHVVIKGGHDNSDPGTDILFSRGKATRISPGNSIIHPKHGSGCVFSAALTAQLAKGYDVESACFLAKTYAEKFLSRTEQLLGYHA